MDVITAGSATRGHRTVDAAPSSPNGVECGSELDAFREPWLRLQHCATRTPFQTYEWNLAWWRAESGPLVEPLIAALRRDGRVVALLPLMLSLEDRGRRVVRWLTTPRGEYGDGLFDRSVDRRAAARELLAWLRAGLGERWDAIELTDTAPWSPLIQASRDQPAWTATPGAECPITQLRDEATLRPLLTRREHRKKERRLCEQGDVAFHLSSDPSWTAGAMERLTELHRREWSERADAVDDTAVVRFQHELTRLLAPTGRLLLAELRLDDRPIAAYCAFASDSRAFGWRTGYDPELRDHSPGHLLYRRMLDTLARAGYREFDWMRRTLAYENRYETGRHATATLAATS